MTAPPTGEAPDLVPLPAPPPPGMTSAQLAAYVDRFTRAACARVLGVGHEQYDQGDGQRFESMPLDELLAWTLEELQDVAVYAAMLGVRVQRLRELLVTGRDTADEA